MQKLQSSTLQMFLENLIEELKRANEDIGYYETKELDIPFIVSSLWQSFNNNPDKYKDFISDLDNYPEYNVLINESKNTYNGIIDVVVILTRCNPYENTKSFVNYVSPEYHYNFEFSYDERHWGYCDCTPDMPDYREDKHCCGHGCDTAFCEFELYKALHITKDTWQGDEHDYWDFEDEFYIDDKELADKKTEEERKRMIEELKNQIESASKKLAELEGMCNEIN